MRFGSRLCLIVVLLAVGSLLTANAAEKPADSAERAVRPADSAERAVCPLELRSYATMHSIGLEWDLQGDANHNARCAVRYRAAGRSQWQDAMPLMRIDYHGWYGDQKADRRYNMLAGSIMFLQPGTRYEVELGLTDPDGGAQTRTVIITTRSEPTLPIGGRTWHVAPGEGEGNGSAEKPLRSLRAAQAAAAPGDTVLLHAGDYGQFTFEKPGTTDKYIVWRAAGDGEVVFSQITVAASNLWLEGLTLRRQASPNGLRTAGSVENVVVRYCNFTGYHYSIMLNPKASGWYIADNVIVGDKENLDASDISGEGIELNHSSGHEVAYNRISRTADGISYPHRNCDIYGNDIRDVTDDGLEPDYGYANVRMWGNRVHRAFNYAVSFQPQYCGPWYIVRNELASRGGALKPNVADCFVLVNNTIVVENRHAQGAADLLLKSLSRNNLWIVLPQTPHGQHASPIWYATRAGRGEKYSMEYQALPGPRTDVDYDGFDWGESPTAFRWEIEPRKTQQFKDLGSFAQAVGIERNGIRVRKEEVFEIQDVAAYLKEPFSQRRLTLKSPSAAIDAGQALPNLCDNYLGAAPDLGAYEFGKPTPHYGPRATRR